MLPFVKEIFIKLISLLLICELVKVCVFKIGKTQTTIFLNTYEL